MGPTCILLVSVFSMKFLWDHPFFGEPFNRPVIKVPFHLTIPFKENVIDDP